MSLVSSWRAARGGPAVTGKRLLSQCFATAIVAGYAQGIAQCLHALGSASNPRQRLALRQRFRPAFDLLPTLQGVSPIDA